MIAHLRSKILLYQTRLTFDMILQTVGVSALLQKRIKLFGFTPEGTGPCCMASVSETVTHMKRGMCLPFVPPDWWCNMIQTDRVCWKWFNCRKNVEKWERESKYVEQKCTMQSFTGQSCLWSFRPCYSKFIFILFIGRTMRILLKTRIHIIRFLSRMGGNRRYLNSSINICFSSI